MGNNRVWARRDVLRGGIVAGAGAALSLLLPAAAHAGLSDGRTVGTTVLGANKTTVLRWLDGRRVPNLRDLRGGWAAPCASLTGQVCPVRLNDLVDRAPVVNWTPPEQLELRLIGYDGVSPSSDHGLEVLYPVDGMRSLVPFQLADVRGNRLTGASMSARAWGWDGRVPLRISSGRGAGASAELVDVPATPGVYLLALTRPDRFIDPAALAFAEGPGGALHRRLIDLYGQAFSDLGYFALSITAVK